MRVMGGGKGRGGERQRKGGGGIHIKGIHTGKIKAIMKRKKSEG